MSSREIGPVRDGLVAAGLDPEDVARTVRLALDEDLRYGPDITTAAVAAPGVRAVANVVARKPGVVAGLPIAVVVSLRYVTWAPRKPDQLSVSGCW